jgi:hypothetical protein
MTEPNEYLLDSSIKALSLSASCQDALLAAHIYTVRGLISLSHSELRELTGLDDSLISLIEGILIANGLSLRKGTATPTSSDENIPHYLIEQKIRLAKRIATLETQIAEARQQLATIDTEIFKIQSKRPGNLNINNLRDAYDAVLSKRPLKEEAQYLGISITTLKGRASKYRRILSQVKEMGQAGVGTERIAALLGITPGQAKQLFQRLATLEQEELRIEN